LQRVRPRRSLARRRRKSSRRGSGAFCRAGDRGITEVANDTDLTETALREWVKKNGGIRVGKKKSKG
jgi:hypothetical protein